MKKGYLAAFFAVATGFVLAIVLCVQALYLPQAVFASSESKMKIVLDAGHGGMDGGVTGQTTGIKESDINLSITLALGDILTDMGFAVAYTRKTQAGLYDTATKGFKNRDMQKRRQIIQAEKPDLIVSIHQNFYPSKTTRGGQVFYEKGAKDGKTFALCVQKRLNALYAQQGAKARNAMSAEYFILECSPVPSVLVECGFLSSQKDEELLQSAAFRKRLAGVIAAGITDFFAGISA